MTAKSVTVISPDAKKTLLSSCAHFTLTPTELERIRDAANSLEEAEWTSVHGEAAARRAVGLLARHLRSAGVDLPRKFAEDQRWISVVNAGWDIELQRLAPRLEEEGVSVLLIKGAALQGHAYREAGLRLMDDVDWILKRGEDIGPARGVLEKCGYSQSGEAFPNIWAREGFLIDLHIDILGEDRRAFRTNVPKILAERSRIVAEIYSRAKTSLLGEPYLVPSPEDHLIILCAHMMKHNFESGIWFSDLEALLHCEPNFDWEIFLERAEAWHLIRPVSYAFRRVGALGVNRRIPIPREALRTLREVRPTRLDGALLVLAEKELTLEGEKDAWRHPPVANLFWLSSRRGLRAKVRLLWDAAFPAGGVMSELYPSYRPALRWWFLARRAGELIRLGARVLAVARAGRFR